MYHIPANDDDSVQVEFSIPVKGRRPLILKVPRFEFIEDAVYRDMKAALTAIDDNQDMEQRDRQRGTILVMLKAFVSGKDYLLCEAFSLGQLNWIYENWNQASNIPLGEYMASNNSSMENTEAPSSTTSTSEATPVETSDAA